MANKIIQIRVQVKEKGSIVMNLIGKMFLPVYFQMV